MNHKFFAWVTLLTGLSLSIVAAFYSIIGLSMVFAGAFWSVVILASVMEISKLVAVSWLYRFRHLASRSVKMYLFAATIVLMMITSLGIFGYLTRAHVATENVVEKAQLELSVIQQTETTLIQRKQQLTDEVNALASQSTQLITQLGNASRFAGSSGAVRVQRETAARRETLLKNIDALNKDLSSVQQQRIAAQNTVNTTSADIGPLRYVAQAIYKKDDIATIRVAVVWLTGIIMTVFDPMAIMLLIAANILFNHKTEPVFEPVTTPPAKAKKKSPVKKAKVIPHTEETVNTVPTLDGLTIDPESDINWSHSISDVPKSLL